ncbi:hypothetical protein CLAN_1603 [Campylobacter lanienae NCTC 13004]|uniref:Uridine kinase n=1 Tax=Campylobacter lanienae NCTC 13004 TaxID=1031753 RepID=A0A1X9SQ00_9BACT|nr:hypothetical protein [Campylobacter lanienae]ARQ98311.1 hypothetical protein CLAN_1603 [Campylobacter lanienae NCTC 13004]
MKIVYTKSQLFNELNQICQEILKSKSCLIIAITGLSGSGKSTLGKFIRKEGFGDFKPYQIAVIDDNVMSLNLFLIRPKIRHTPPPSNPVDNLKPFFKFLPSYIKLIFYINANATRVNFADILITLKIDETQRINQLNQRESDPKLIKSLINSKLNIDISSTYQICFNNSLNN